MMSMNLNDIAIVIINCFDNCCIINGIRKCEVVNLLRSLGFSEKSGTL